MNLAVSNTIRWLAAITGVFTAVVGLLPTYLMSPLLCSPLVVGAALAGRSPRSGRIVMWCGAVLLSLVTFPLGVWFLLLPSGTDPNVILAAVMCILIVVWCDVALALDLVGLMRGRRKNSN